MAEKYTYQWKRDGAPIVGAQDARYMLTESDSGAYISCYLTRSSENYSISLEKGIQAEDINISSLDTPLLRDGQDNSDASKEYSEKYYVTGHSFSGFGISVVFAYYVNGLCIGLVSEMDIDNPVFWAKPEVGDKITCVVRVANKWGSIEVPAIGSITIIP